MMEVETLGQKLSDSIKRFARAEEDIKEVK